METFPFFFAFCFAPVLCAISRPIIGSASLVNMYILGVLCVLSLPTVRVVWYQGKDLETIDLKRTGRSATAGLLIHGPLCHFWIQLMQTYLVSHPRTCPGTAITTVVPPHVSCSISAIQCSVFYSSRLTQGIFVLTPVDTRQDVGLRLLASGVTRRSYYCSLDCREPNL